MTSALRKPPRAATGMFLYLLALKRSTPAAILGSISYGFSLFMIVFLEYNTIGHVILWLPFLLTSIEQIGRSPRARYRILFIISIVSSAFAGHLQIFGAILMFGLFYSIFIYRSLPILKEITVLTILSLGIACIQLIPTAELLQYSARVNHTYEDMTQRLLLQPKQLFSFVNPDIFGNPATGNYLLTDSYPGKALFFGFFAFFFALLGIAFKKNERIVTFYSLSSVLLLVFISSNPLSRIIYQFKLPFISQSAPGNFLFLLVFSGATLASHGIDNWISSKKSVKHVYIIFCTLIFLLWSGYITHVLAMNKPMLFLTTGMFGILTVIVSAVHFFPIKKIAVIGIIVLTTGELWYSFQKFNPFVPSELLYPETGIVDFLKKQPDYFRMYGFGAADFEANFSTQLGIYDSNGYDPLYPNQYGTFIESSKNGVLSSGFNTSTRSDARIAPGYGTARFDDNMYRSKVLNVLSVKYIVNKIENGTDEKTFPPDDYPLIYKQDDFLVHENKKTLPKTFLTSEALQVNSDEAFSGKFFSVEFDPHKTILLREPPPSDLTPSSGKSQIVQYDPTNIKITTESVTNQMLFLSDTYFPGWEASIDGEKTYIYNADYAFRSVFVPAGKHTVRFTYNPLSFVIGRSIALLSFVCLLIYLIWRKITYSLPKKTIRGVIP